MQPSGSDSESRLSSDRETIRGWTEEHEHGAVPVRRRGEGGAEEVRIVRRDLLTEDHEEMTWEEFHDYLDQQDAVVVYHGTELEEPFEVTARDEAIRRSAVEDETVEEALLEGETVTTEITETTVVERTVVEEASIESEVIDRELVEKEIVEAELLSRDVNCEVTGFDSDGADVGATGTDAGATDAGTTGVDRNLDAARFEAGYRWDEPVRVEVDVDEEWRVTNDVLELVTIESEVVRTDVTESETVEEDTVERRVDVEGVKETILDSGLVDADAETTEILESTPVEGASAEGEGDVVHTQLVERKTVEERVDLEKHYAGDVTGETTAASTVSSEVVESVIVDREDIEFEMETVVDTRTDVETDLETGSESGTDAAGSVTAATPTEEDEGKTVVDAAGREIGIVAEVEGEVIYVDPHPSITDKIKAALDWGDMDEDEDTRPVFANRIARITDDRVELVDGSDVDEER